MTGLLLETLPQVVVERMLNSALEGVVLAALAWVLLKVVGRRSSSTRFAVWFVVLLTVGALPWMEALRLGGSAISTGLSSTGLAKSAILIPSSWALAMFYVWSAVAAACLGRVALGLWQIRRLRLTSSQVDPGSLDPVLRQALVFSSERPISLYVSRSVRVPMATGFFRPMIVIPGWALQDLSVEELKVVLLHEAAHLQRWDDWTNLAQKVFRAVFFFHPVVWWLESKLALEREMACDELVVATTSSPRAYAECLVALAEKSYGRRNIALAQAAVSRVRHTSLRIRQILDEKRSVSTAVWKPAVGLAATAAMVCLLLVGETPKLIGFASPTSPAGAADPVLAQSFSPELRSDSLIKRTSFSWVQQRQKSAKRSLRTPAVSAPVREPVVNTEVATKQTEDAAIVPVQMEEPSPVPTAAPFRTVAFTAEQTVFVVMQDQQLNAAGDRVVRFNVYRWTVFYPEFYPSNPQKPLNKSI